MPLEKPDLVLQWGDMPHTVECKLLGDCVLCVLTIRKVVTQCLTVLLPPGITIDMIREAWATEIQGKNWREIARVQEGVFLAARALQLPGGCLVWYVLHINGTPFDAFRWAEGLNLDAR